MTDSTEANSIGQAIAPGTYLRDELAARHMSQTELARRMGRPIQAINSVVNRKKALTQETALELERVLGTPAQVWVNLEARYRLALARAADDSALRTELDWLDRFPVGEMEHRGWIPTAAEPVARLRALLKFFGVASFSNWDAEYQEALGFRVTGNAAIDTGALAAWVRKGEVEGIDLETADYDEALFREAIEHARVLTTHPPSAAWRDLQQTCARAGVAAIVVPEFAKIGANGVARWLNPRKALIQLNLRYSWADIFWFTFFHEAAHVLMHEHRHVFVELDGNPRRSPREVEANRLAEELLIPVDAWEEFVLRSEFSESSIRAAASDLGIDPGIVVGRLQHNDLVPWGSKLNSLRSRLEWA